MTLLQEINYSIFGGAVFIVEVGPTVNGEMVYVRVQPLNTISSKLSAFTLYGKKITACLIYLFQSPCSFWLLCCSPYSCISTYHRFSGAKTQWLPAKIGRMKSKPLNATWKGNTISTTPLITIRSKAQIMRNHDRYSVFSHGNGSAYDPEISSSRISQTRITPKSWIHVRNLDRIPLVQVQVHHYPLPPSSHAAL